MQNRFKWWNGKSEVFQWFRQQHLRGYTYVYHVHCMHSVHIFCSVLYTLWCVRVFLVFSVVFFALAHIAMQEHIHSTQQHSLNFNAFKRIIFRAIQVSVCYRFFASLFLLIRILFAWSYIVPQPPSTTYRCNCTVTVHTTGYMQNFANYFLSGGRDTFNQFNQCDSRHEHWTNTLNYWMQLLLFQNVNVNQSGGG